jgi:hypothetical protein
MSGHDDSIVGIRVRLIVEAQKGQRALGIAPDG